VPEGHAAIQRGLNRLEKWAGRNLLKFKEEKCKVLHLKRNNPRHQYMLGPDQMQTSFAEKAPNGRGEHQVGHEVEMCPCNKEGHWYPGLEEC